MNQLLILNIGVFCVFTVVGSWLGWQLLRQNGRVLLRLDELEKRLDELELGEPDDEPHSEESEIRNPNSEIDQSLATSAAANGEENGRATRFGNRSLARSKIKRDGLKAGTPAPDIRLPCLDGTERSLQDFRGRRVLLVFSDPHCGPCNALAPQLEEFHRAHPEVSVVMISRGEPSENRAKAKEHGLTFPILLQQRWEISRRYAMFATPVAYLIDEAGVIAHDVAVGVDQIQALLSIAAKHETESVPASFVLNSMADT